MAKQKNKTTGHIKIDPERDPELIVKLRAVNSVPPYILVKPNTLARMLLNQKLDEIISQRGIIVNYS
jgi:hypothetical protein